MKSLLRLFLVFTLVGGSSISGLAAARTAQPGPRSEGAKGSVSDGADERPNVLIILTDDQRLSGTMWALPSVMKWFGAEGTEFVNSYATTPLCCPARASILTGKYMHNHEVVRNGNDAVQSLDFTETMPAYLRGAGYRTALIGKYFNPWPATRQPSFFDRWVESAFGYYDSIFNIQGQSRLVHRYSTSFMANKAKQYIRSASEREDPWFLYLAPLAPHAPYTPQRKYEDATVPAFPANPSSVEVDRSDKPPWVANKDSLLSRSVATYEKQLRMLMSVDDLVEGVMQTLEETGEAENTLAFFLSDHGFLWHEHGLRNKRQPYLPSVQVPLFARWPGIIEPGLKDERLAANIDLLPTILEAAGLEAPEAEGISLLSDQERAALFLEYDRADAGGVPSWDSILTHDAQYIRYYGPDPEGEPIFREYYDLEADPYQLSNVQGDVDPLNDLSADRLLELDALVDQMRTCSGEACRMYPPTD